MTMGELPLGCTRHGPVQALSTAAAIARDAGLKARHFRVTIELNGKNLVAGEGFEPPTLGL
jgi:hypothetical protein